jgi:hypothetical protein
MTRLAAIASILRARSHRGSLRRVQSILLAIVVTLGVSVATLGAGVGPAGADDSAPVFFGQTSATAYGGNPFALQVQANGIPFPTLSLSGPAPAGLTVTDDGLGRGVINWTPPADITTPETDSVTVTATNTEGMATETITIMVVPGLTITGPPTYKVADGDPLEAFWRTYINAVTPPSLTESGALPAGLTFVDDGSGDAQLKGTTSSDGSADGVYPITVTAHNGIEPDETSTTIITVEPPSPVTFTSASSLTVQVGQPFSFTVTTGGAPNETLMVGAVNSRPGSFPSNPFPSGVSFVDNGDGTATLSGTVQPDEAGQHLGEFLTFYPFPGFARPTQIFTLNAVLPGQASFTSAASATALVGDPFSFTVATTGGDPTPALSLSGALPSTLSFTDNGDGTATISGAAPTDTDVGQYPLTLTATNTVATSSQTFAVSVEEPVAPAFTSADSATAHMGTPFSFTVTTTGTPAAALTESGALPSTFTFHDNGDGTATIAGIPVEGEDITDYALEITADNASGTATQEFTLAVDDPIALTGPATYRAADGVFFDLGIDTTEIEPQATLTESGALPPGLVFFDDGDGSSNIRGATSGDGSADGVYPITITADNGFDPDATFTMVLTIEPPSNPGITSATSDTVEAGVPFSFTVTSSGAPMPRLTANGIFSGPGFHTGPAFPDGVSFVDNGDGTGTISGMVQTSGTYLSELVAQSTGVNIPGFEEEFTLNVVAPGQPAFTSADAATAITGTPFNFTVTTTGTPTPALSLSGTLPADLQFLDNGDGTATISGTEPPDADVGQYQPVTISATNSAGTTTQSLTLTVRPPLAITGPTTYTAADGSFFDVQPNAGGFAPEPSLTESGALPPGVTFADSGFGSADVEGTTSGDGSADGVYPITITAHDGIEPDATETIVLTIAPPSPPAFTGVPRASVAVGTPFSVTVATSGAPSANVRATGRVPFHSGVIVTNNQDGTATISGTVNTPGNYQAQLQAISDAGSTSEIFTLIVLQPAPACVATACDSAVGTDPDGSVQVQSGGSTGLTATADGVGGLTVGQYTADPESSPAIGASGAYFDVADSIDNIFTSLTLNDCDLLGGNNVQWWNPNANAGAGGWQPVSNQTYHPGSPGCVEVDISPTTSPALFQLSGTVFAVGAGNLAPTVTSASSTTATISQPMSFTVTTSGYPTAALTRTGTLPTGVTFVDNGDGTATLAGTPSGTAKTYPLKFTAKNAAGSVSQSFSLVVQQVPAITSATTATFTTAKTGTFKVTTTGSPAAALSIAETLPAGVNFVDNGNGTATLSGTATTGGVYPLTITATNAAGTTSQTFSLVVDQAPAVTSAATAIYAFGQPTSFTVTTSGYPTAALTQTGTLPTGVTFVDNGDGTATLAGTPTGTAKTYALKFTAKNAAGSVSQSFSLVVIQAPVFTSAATATFTTGKAGTFKVTTTGFPTATMSETGPLPEGLNLIDNGNGTATLSGTPVAGIGGTYSLSMRAANAVDVTSQVFTLVINQAPSVTSATTKTVNVGQAMSFGVATTGFPTPTLTQTGTLPAGVTFMDNGDGTATLSGTPTGAAKTYAFKISAKNAAGTGAQSFTLVVQQAPAITSGASATFTTTKTGTFKVTTSGSPAAALSSVGALPTGVTFVDNGNGTATFTGAASTSGLYPLTISATNAVGTTSQSFTLVVNQVPAVTSAASMTATIGHAMSFNVTTAGVPTPALTFTGTLPTGVTFVDNGNGTATLSGTPTGTAKTYALKITAKNIAGTATQNFSFVLSH